MDFEKSRMGLINDNEKKGKRNQDWTWQKIETENQKTEIEKQKRENLIKTRNPNEVIEVTKIRVGFFFCQATRK